MKQKRSLGQLFLINPKYIQKIVESLNPKNKVILEIGSGKGALTEFLSAAARRLYCLEIDGRFCDFLKTHFAERKNLKIIQADVLKFPLSRLGKSLTVFGNIPYHISSRLITYLVNYRKFIAEAYLVFQREFVQKLVAVPSSCSYNFLSCYIQYYAKIERLFDIKASSFRPVPRVDSTLIKINFYPKPPYPAGDEKFLFRVIRKAFSARRKKILNSLPVAGDKNRFFLSLGINPDLRAEDVAIKEYVAIANKLKNSV
jgi:16S rRNA (adenine1518-N6/adenine1519-N6)-dimethyltransferase